jgi:hypothetical protein
MELRQLDASELRFLAFRRASQNALWRALQNTHGALFAFEFFEEYECEIERAAQRLGESLDIDRSLTCPGFCSVAVDV